MPKSKKQSSNDAALQSIQGHLASINKRLKLTLAKTDAKNFSTKDNLKAFATKDDLKPLAKQVDLLYVKEKVDYIEDFLKEFLPNLTEWTDDFIPPRKTRNSQ